ncbi:MAG: molybdopterin-synthase adenylyltransferase [Solirubrobacteraceae bacterium]|jgi:molybdopterin/thiamine biosynthesis adenylyltransferase|nr:molybdopterin-synthase adenylyltransferase [Solirubrobacteraceae bacterium]
MESSRRGLFRTAAQAAARAALPQDPPSDADALALERYSRQLVLEGWGEAQQRRLHDASVLVIGAGALGSPVATYLAGAGVGRIGVLDGDLVELSNLHRQHLHLTPEVGRPKAHTAVGKLQLLNPEVMVEPYQVRLDADNVEGLVLGHDLVIDCSDSFDTRYLVNEACCVSGTWLVEGGVLGVAGMVMSIRPGSSACYRCAFPEPPPDAPTCASAGILGPAAGVVGSLMALEAMKLLGGLEGALLDAFLQVDLASYDFLRVTTARRPDCPDCG